MRNPLQITSGPYSRRMRGLRFLSMGKAVSDQRKASRRFPPWHLSHIAQSIALPFSVVRSQPLILVILCAVKAVPEFCN